MTFLAGLCIALLRATLVAIAALALGWCVRRTMAASRAALRLIVPALLLVFLTPTLLLGYAYSDGPLSLARHALWNELLYSSLLALKLLPVAVAVLYFAPAPGLSREAAFLRSLAPAGSEMATQRRRYAARFLFQGPARGAMLAFIAVFLLAFCDFELAALMNVASGRAHSAYTWTIALHEARQLNAPLGSILWRVAAAAACEALVLGSGVWLLWGSRGGLRDQAPVPHGLGWMTRVTAAIGVGVVLLAVCVLPGWIVLRGAAAGMSDLLAAFRFGDELLSSLYFAAGATGLVLIALAGLGHRAPLKRNMLLLSLCLPGLLGALVLGMVLMAFFQLPVLRGLYDTPAPLVLGLSLLIMPVAVLLRWFFDENEPASALHLAALLRESPHASQRRAGRWLGWELRGRSWFYLGAFVFYVCYLELVLCVTLAPVAMTPAIVELYNQMHYGQRALLSSLLAVTMALPVALVAMGWAVRWCVGRVSSIYV